VAVIGMLVAILSKKGANCTLVSQTSLAGCMLSWGFTVVRHRLALLAVVLIVYLALVGAGLPRLVVDEGSLSEWVPSGGRLEKQIQDWDTYVDNSVTDRTYAHILISAKDGANLIDDPKKWLQATLDVVSTVYTTATVTAQDTAGNDLTLSWSDFCFSINHPILTSEVIHPVFGMISAGTMGNSKPCINPSVLDPFLEQSWEFDGPGTVKQQKRSSFDTIAAVAATACAVYGDSYCGQVSVPFSYPSFNSLTDEEVVTRLKMNGIEYGHWITAASQPWGKLYGSFQGDSTPADPTDRTLTYAKSFVYTLYQDIPLEVVQHRASVMGMAPDAFRDANKAWLLEMEKQLKILHDDDTLLPNVHVAYFPGNAIDRMYEEVSSAQASTIIIGYAVVLFLLVVTQYSSSRTTNFMLLGLLGGILVCLSNLAAYGLIALIDLKFNHTMLQALPFLALGLGVDDLFLVLHAFRTIMKQWSGRRAEVIVALTMMEAGSSVTITSWCNAGVFFVSCLIPIPALRNLLLSAGVVVLLNWVSTMTLTPVLLHMHASKFESHEKEAQLTAEEVVTLIKHNDSLEAASKTRVGRFYSAFSESSPLKLVFLLVGAALLAGMSACIGQVEFGYDNTDLAKRGAYLATGINDMYDQVYSQHSSETVVFGTGIDYEKDQAALLAVHKMLGDTKWSAYGTSYGRSGSSANTWLTNMYGNGETGVCPYWNLYGDGVDPWFMFYEDLHLWRKPQVWLEPRDGTTLAFGGLFAGLLDRANEWPYTLGAADYTPNNKLIMSWDEVELNMNLLKTTDDKLQMVRDFRKITMDSGLNVYMYGWLFLQLEQFLDLDWYFWVCCAASMSVVFLISLLFGMSWLGALLIACFSIALCAEVYGSLYVLDISYQTLAASSMLMSIGIAVEYTAHTVAAFEFASGTRNERLAKAMAKTAEPVAYGALSSVLSFIFLAASDFAFVRKYFLFIFLAICFFGIVNGLVFLPSLLGLLGASKTDHGQPALSHTVGETTSSRHHHLTKVLRAHLARHSGSRVAAA